ncbi:MAG TPA: hypothetical protein PLU16_12780 [Gallionellaceae bacterium]|jgi:hypothetical protein|nr:hypothetical protein [Gallionellaceae bacterium]HQS76083.1 hypothetical protein [Gallionellaceae bacterium]
MNLKNNFTTIFIKFTKNTQLSNKTPKTGLPGFNSRKQQAGILSLQGSIAPAQAGSLLSGSSSDQGKLRVQ